MAFDHIQPGHVKRMTLLLTEVFVQRTAGKSIKRLRRARGQEGFEVLQPNPRIQEIVDGTQDVSGIIPPQLALQDAGTCITPVTRRGSDDLLDSLSSALLGETRYGYVRDLNQNVVGIVDAGNNLIPDSEIPSLIRSGELDINVIESSPKFGHLKSPRSGDPGPSCSYDPEIGPDPVPILPANVAIVNVNSVSPTIDGASVIADADIIPPDLMPMGDLPSNSVIEYASFVAIRLVAEHVRRIIAGGEVSASLFKYAKFLEDTAKSSSGDVSDKIRKFTFPVEPDKGDDLPGPENPDISGNNIIQDTGGNVIIPSITVNLSSCLLGFVSAIVLILVAFLIYKFIIMKNAVSNQNKKDNIDDDPFDVDTRLI